MSEGRRLAGRGGPPRRRRRRGNRRREGGGSKTTLTLAYQREHAAGDYFDVLDDTWPVSQTVDIKVTGG
jgi:hypothetical protein